MQPIQITPFMTALLLKPNHVGQVLAAPKDVDGEVLGAAADVGEAEIAAGGHGVGFFDEGEFAGGGGGG
ncbi:MAG: hypothetical protein Q9186_005216 [Xanthomendoza sp. 1 TL-2023]